MPDQICMFYISLKEIDHCRTYIRWLWFTYYDLFEEPFYIDPYFMIYTVPSTVCMCRLFCGFLFQCKMQKFGDELFSQRLHFHALFTRWIRNCKFSSKLSIWANSPMYLCIYFHYKVLRTTVHSQLKVQLDFSTGKVPFWGITSPYKKFEFLHPFSKAS